MKKNLGFIVIILLLAVIGCTQATAGSSVRLEVIDRTAGEYLDKNKLNTIRNSVVKQLKAELPDIIIQPQESDDELTTLKVYLDAFTAGNRAARFWVGFGLGKAHLRMEAEWLDGSPLKVVDSKIYQRFGAMSLRGRRSIEAKMTLLVGQYAADFATSHYLE